MRRTYRSKKDADGALDHRDVLQKMDEKSSLFDAFYIQNIKQNRRELSCVGSSNAGFNGVATKKVRKRKYVKRIVKEVENVQPRESVSTYLTPDKSIRVNKILDPFDELLNTSSTVQSTAATIKNNLFNVLPPKKEGKTYTKKKLVKVKKFNYSSEYSSDSDKENASNLHSNMTDIRTHELLVETEPNNSPKLFDESINKIVNNLSLINNFKRKNSAFNTSYKQRNRLTKNCQSPILQKSPLCSTPFKDKYRGKSIYNFSPISSKESASHNYMTITEENNDSNNSIVFLCKEKVPKLSEEHSFPLIPVDNKKKDESIIYEDEEINSLLCSPVGEIEKHVENETKAITKHKYSQSNQSSFQITEIEPFLGFSDDKVTESVINDKNYLLKCVQKHNSQNDELQLNTSGNDIKSVEEYKETIINDSKIEKSLHNFTVEESNLKDVASTNDREKLEHFSIDNASEQKLDISESEHDKSNKETSQEDSSFEDFESSDEDDNRNDKDYSVANPNINVSKETTISDSNNSSNSGKESMYDTCESEQSFSDEYNDKMEPKVAIERLNDSVFIKYYEKMLRDQVESTSSESINGERQSDVDTSQSGNETDEVENQDELIEVNKSIDSVYNCSQDHISSATESDSVEALPNEIVITDSSTAEDVESYESNNEDERQVSFVTTRRRIEITNDSMFVFDNSYGSTSTDCDKTVLSNKARLSCFEQPELELKISVNKDKICDANKLVPCEDELSQDEGNSIHLNTRKSSRLTRNSETDIDSTLSEVTIIENEENDGIVKDLASKNTSKLRNSDNTRKGSKAFRNSCLDRSSSISTEVKPSIVLQPGKKWERSLSIYRRMTTMADHFNQSLLEDDAQRKGRKYRQSVISTMEMQDSLHNESINSRRSTFISKPSRSTIRFVKESNNTRISLNTTEVFDDLQGFLTEECDDTVIELSKLSLAESELDVTVLDNLHDTSGRIATARDYVLRRCNQTDTILFDECYPETVLKNCHKIGEGVYGEVFLWRGRDGRARVMKIVPIAGSCKVNGEQQKDFHEVISEIVIAMELSALRAPIADIDRYFDEGKDVEALDLHAVENATDVFNEVLAVRCVQGPFPSRLLDLWELYDECKGSENDSPAALPADQQYMVLELANAGQDLESYQFTGAQQAHALFQQIAFGIAVGEEAFQFEHRDLHWGNVLIAPTEQKLATFVLRGRTYRVPRGGVAATIIDYSLSRISLPLGAERAALYNDLGTDEQLFDAVGDYQFQVYRLMRDKLGNEWKNYEPYTNILWLHYTVDKMITALRYKRTTTKIHKHYIEKLKGIKDRILDYKSATEYVLTDIEI